MVSKKNFQGYMYNFGDFYITNNVTMVHSHLSNAKLLSDKYSLFKSCKNWYWQKRTRIVSRSQPVLVSTLGIAPGSRQNDASSTPKCHILGTYEYVILYGKRDTVGMIKLSILSCRYYSGSSKKAQHYPKDVYKWKREARTREGEKGQRSETEVRMMQDNEPEKLGGL